MFQAVCSCPARSTGNARNECRQLACIENNDCAVGKSCVSNECVDVCSLSGVCGPNAKCSVVNHTPLCSCQEGFTGEPTQGCSPVLQCTGPNDCPNNMICAFGVCSRKFNTFLMIILNHFGKFKNAVTCPGVDFINHFGP